MTTPPVSVCMATYNGLPYVSEQLRSILNQLREEDEVVIVDDCSSDGTLQYLKTILDRRLRILANDVNIGHVRTFERTLREARNDIVLLTDQDDVWLPHHRDTLAAASARYGLAVSNFDYLNDAQPAARYDRLTDHDRPSVAATLGKILFGRSPYFGCVMAIRRDVLQLALPIPTYVEAHDIWIAIVALMNRKICHVESATTLRRIHASNLTPPSRRPMSAVVRTRIAMLRIIVTAAAFRRSTACS